jgi:hypothetical protein
MKDGTNHLFFCCTHWLAGRRRLPLDYWTHGGWHQPPSKSVWHYALPVCLILTEKKSFGLAHEANKARRSGISGARNAVLWKVGSSRYIVTFSSVRSKLGGLIAGGLVHPCIITWLINDYAPLGRSSFFFLFQSKVVTDHLEINSGAFLELLYPELFFRPDTYYI